MNNSVWQPQTPKATQMWEFLQMVAKKHQKDFTSYKDLHAWSVDNPALFWHDIQLFFNLTFDTPPQRILSPYDHMMEATWFDGAMFNYAEKLLSRKDEHPAIISIDENGKRETLSYRELNLAVASCAAGFKALGIGKGDTVAAVLPNVSYTVIAFLASASLGAIWASCSPDFGVHAAVDRLGQIEPKLLLVADGHQYHGKRHHDLTKAKEIVTHIPSVKHIIVCPGQTHECSKNTI